MVILFCRKPFNFRFGYKYVLKTSFEIKIMFPGNLSLLIIDIVTHTHPLERCSHRVLAFIHFSITGCSMEPHFQRSHDPQRRSHKTFCTYVPSFPRQIRCPCLRNRMRSARRRISSPIPRKFFNLRILSFPHEEFHSSSTILVLTHLAKYVMEYLANYTSFSYQAGE